MRSFWFNYLFTAIVGTWVIHVGAPYVKPLLTRQPDRTEASDFASSAIRAAPPSETKSPAPADATAWATPRQAPDAMAQPGPRPRDAAPEPPPVVVTTPDLVPSTHTIPASGDGVTHWGLTLRQTPFYTRDGSRRDEELPGGTLVEQIASSTSSRGQMALCRISRPYGWVGPYLVATADLLRFRGTRDGVADADVRALRHYYELNGRLDARIQALKRAAVDANPYASSLRQAHALYEKGKLEAARLTAERDAATGSARTRLDDQLRRLKNEEPELNRRVKRLNDQYKAWQSRNGKPTETTADDDPVTQALKRELAALKPGLAAFGVR